MKAISLVQPYATLVAIGAKRIETRSRNFVGAYRGPLAIHASGALPKWARDIYSTEPFKAVLAANGITDYCQLPLGKVLAYSNLVAVLPMEARGCLSGVFADYPELDTPQERAFGDYSVGRLALVLEDIKRLDVPIPAKGALGLWQLWGERGANKFETI